MIMIHVQSQKLKRHFRWIKVAVTSSESILYNCVDTFRNSIKVGYVFQMVIVSILPHAEFGPNDDREDAPHFIQNRLHVDYEI